MATLAMVFSVQQGAHGPLVVYKLEVPGSAATAAPTVAPEALPKGTLGTVVMPQRPQAAPLAGRRLLEPAKTPRLSPLQPTVLGTVAMPAPRHATPPPVATVTAAAPIPLLPLEQTAAPVELDPLAFSSLYRGAPSELDDDGMMINAYTGEELTLEEVNDAVAWRRDTAEKLRRLQVGPRF